MCVVVVRYLCTKISPSCKLSVFLCLSWAFPWICTVTLNFPPYMQLLLNDLIFNAWLTKGEKWKMKGGKRGHWPFKSPGSYFSWRERCLQQPGNWQSEQIPVFGGQGPFYPPWFLQTVHKLFQEHAYSCLPCGWWWKMGSCDCSRSSNWLKQTAIYHRSLPWQLRAFNRFYNSRIVLPDRWCLCNCLRGGRFLVLPTPPSSQNSLPSYSLFWIVFQMCFFFFSIVF